MAQRLVAAAVACEQAHPSLGVKNVRPRRVVHAVAARGLARHFGEIDLEVLGSCQSFLGTAAQSDEIGRKVGHIRLQQIGRVALGVDGDKHPLDSEPIGAQCFFHLCQLEQGRGANVGALCEAEEDDCDFAFEVQQSATNAMGVGQIQLAGVVSPGDVNRFEARRAAACWLTATQRQCSHA